MYILNQLFPNVSITLKIAIFFNILAIIDDKLVIIGFILEAGHLEKRRVMLHERSMILILFADDLDIADHQFVGGYRWEELLGGWIF